MAGPRALPAIAAGAVLATGLVVLTATPAAAHNVSGGAMPAPSWLLSYIGAFAVAGTALALRTAWPATRLATPASQAEPGPIDRVHPGRILGIALLIAVIAVALSGPDSAAANLAPVTVLVVWWVGLPLLCLLLGDVMRAINPFVGLVALVRRDPEDPEPGAAAPSWTGAAFLAAFIWYFIAYHRPGSPRSLVVFLLVYAALAVAAGLRWGPRWLAAGEGFGALSAAVATISLRRSRTGPPPGVAALMVVWVGGTAFDAFSSVPFWGDVLGTSMGWERTLLNTVGLIWITAVVAGIYLLAVRLSGADASALGVALVPLAVGWFLAHDLTLLLFEGQNFLALLSDPLGRGWDLFGTITHTIDYGVVEAAWVPWAQISVLTAGHLGAVVLAHDRALSLLGRRSAMRVTWAMAAAIAASVVCATLLVLG